MGDVLLSRRAVLAGFWTLVQDGDLVRNLGISLSRVACGFGAGALAGLLLGAGIAVHDVTVSLVPTAARSVAETLMYPRFQSYMRGALVFCGGAVLVMLL